MNKKKEVHYSKCCDAPIYVKNKVNGGLWCSKCYKEVFHTQIKNKKTWEVIWDILFKCKISN